MEIVKEISKMPIKILPIPFQLEEAFTPIELLGKLNLKINQLIERCNSMSEILNNLDTYVKAEVDVYIATILEDITTIKEKITTLETDNTTNKAKISAIETEITNIKNRLDTIETTYLKKSDIVDNLTSTDTDKPLSAKQGGILATMIGTLNTLKTLVKTNLVSAINEIYDMINYHINNVNNPHETSIQNLTDTDIDLTTLTTGQVLKYNGTSKKWYNGAGGGGGTGAVDSVNGKDGTVILYGTDIKVDSSATNNLKEAIDNKVDNVRIADSVTDSTYKIPNGKAITDYVGLLSSLLTTAKDNVVNAINELFNSLANKVNVSDIVDNLTSTDTNKPLSAKQGYQLKSCIGDLTQIAPRTNVIKYATDTREYLTEHEATKTNPHETSIQNLTDTEIDTTTLATGQTIEYDTTDLKWKNKTLFWTGKESELPTTEQNGVLYLIYEDE